MLISLRYKEWKNSKTTFSKNEKSESSHIGLQRERSSTFEKMFGNYANSMPSRGAIKAFDNASFVAIKRIQ